LTITKKKDLTLEAIYILHILFRVKTRNWGIQKIKIKTDKTKSSHH